MAGSKRVLVTGMAGQIGGIIRRFLGEKYDLSGVDRVPVEDCPSVVAELSDLEAIRPAFDGKETVVHMGADPSPRAPWESILESNIVGTRNVFEASRDAGVKRVIFASSNHVVGFYPLKQDPYKAVYDGRLGEIRRPFPMLTAEALRPDSLYGVSKAFGESMGSYYHDRYDISVICLRIGWVMTPDDPRLLGAVAVPVAEPPRRSAANRAQHRRSAVGRLRHRLRHVEEQPEHLGPRDGPRDDRVRPAGWGRRGVGDQAG